MPKRAGTTRRAPVYWWTNKIAELESKCLKLRRKILRARRKSLKNTKPTKNIGWLFPQHPDRIIGKIIKTKEVPLFITEELRVAARSTPNGKAPDTNGILAEEI